MLFWIGFVFLLFSLFMLCEWVIDNLKHEPWKLNTVAIIGIIVLIIFSIYMIDKQISLDSEKQQKMIQEVTSKEWNSGKCSSCGNKLRLMSTPATKSKVYYIYTCDNCGHTLQFEQPME